MTGILGRWLRKRLAKRGYSLTKRQFQRYGIDPLTDVARIAEDNGWPIAMCFDVGANIGQTAADMRAAFPAATIHSFEPVAATFSRLCSNSAGQPDIHTHHLALSDTDGKADIHVFGDSSLVSSLEPTAIYTSDRLGESVAESCDTMRLDHFAALHGIGPIDLLKIDTEGHDLAVLRGAAETLRSGRVRFVLTEFNGLFPFEGAAGGALADTGAHLRNLGFDFIASYIDDIHFRDRVFVVGNALFVHVDGK